MSKIIGDLHLLYRLCVIYIKGNFKGKIKKLALVIMHTSHEGALVYNCVVLL